MSTPPPPGSPPPPPPPGPPPSSPPPPPPPPGFPQSPPQFPQQPPPPPGWGGQPVYGGSPGYPTPPPGYGAPLGYQGYQQASTDYASFWSRFGAYLIDGLIGALFTVPGWIVLFTGPRHIVDCTVDHRDARCRVPTGGTIGLAVLLGIAGFVLFLVLYGRRLGRGHSWGQQATGIRTMDASTGQPIGTGRAIGRFFAMYLSSFLFGLGYWWMLWDKKHQCWHDKLVSCVIVKDG